MRGSAFVLALLALLALLPASARGEQTEVAGALVQEDAHAIDKVRLADESAGAGQWEEACQLYLDVLENPKLRDTLLGVKRGPEGKYVLYARAADVVRRRLLDLPPEGRAAFRKLNDSKARALFAVASGSGDRAKLQQIADCYFLSEVGQEAAWLLARMYMEEGAVDRALPLLDTLARDGTFLPPALVVARRAACLAALGQGERIREAASDPHLPADARVTFAGRSVTLREYLQEAASHSAPAARAETGTPSESWPTFGGDATRNRAMGPDVPLPPKSWSARIPPGATRRLGFYAFGEETDETDIRPGARSAVVPAIADGVLYLHNDIGVWAWQLISNKAELLWRSEQPIAPREVLAEQRVLHTTTVADGVVYVNLVNTVAKQKEQLEFLLVKAPLPVRALCAFDARTGKLLWRKGGQEQAKDLALRASFPSAPAVEGGRVYAAATYHREDQDPVQQHVFCLDAKTGEVIWTRYVAVGFLEMNLFNNSTREMVGSSITIAGDTLYYCSNFGVIAALDKGTGRPRWIKRYEQHYIPPTHDLTPVVVPDGWDNNPVIVTGDFLLAAPMDSPYLYCLSATDGEEVHRMSRASQDDPICQATWLLGVQGNRVVLAGPDMAAAIELKTWKLKWRWRPEPRDPVVGRGALTADTVYLPCLSSLCRVDLPSGKKLDGSRWPDTKRDPGNVLVVDNTVVSASASQVAVFYSWEALSKWLEKELATSPDDPALRMRAARSLLQAGRPDQAMEHLEKALRLASGSSDPAVSRIGEEARETLFRLLREVGKAALDTGKAEEALRLMKRARELAATAGERVQARADLARALAAAGSASEAVAELSKTIQEDPDVPVEGGRAWDQARLEIARIVKTSGEAAYAPQEAAATERLKAAAGDEKKLDEVIRLFPNSRTAETAAANLCETAMTQGRLEDAVTRLRAFLRDFPESERFAQANVDLAECYRKRGMDSKARIVLRQVERQIAGAKVTVGGKETTVEGYLKDVLGAPQGPTAMALPEVTWPVAEAWKVIETRKDTLRVLDAEGAPPAGAARLVFVAAGTHLRAIDAEGGAVRWERELPSDPSRCGWSSSGALLVALDRDQVVAIDAASGKVSWSCDVPGSLVARFDAEAAYAIVSDRTNSAVQRVVAVDAKTGREKWSLPLDQRQAGNTLYLSQDTLLFQSTSPRGRALLIVDRDSGEIARAIPMDAPVSHLLVLPPDEVALVTGERDQDVRVYEVSSGKLLWTASLNHVQTPTLCTNGRELALVARSATGAWELVALDIETGKVVARAPVGAQDYVNSAVADDARAYVVFREAGGAHGIYVRAFSLADGSTAWTRPIVEEEGYVCLPPVLAHGSIVASTPLFRKDPDVPYSPFFTVLSTKDGEVEQQTKLTDGSRSPPETEVRDGVLLIVQGNRLYAFQHH